MHLQRQRYLLFEYFLLDPETELKEKEIINTIWSTLTKLFGEYSAYKTGLWMIEFDPENNWGILRCNNITDKKLIASLAFIRQIKNIRVIFHTINASGTIKKIKKIQKHYFSKHRNKVDNDNETSH